MRSGTSACNRYTVMNSSGKLKGEPKWFTPPFTWSGFRMSQMSFLFLSSAANTGSSAYTALPRPNIPGPDANCNYLSISAMMFCGLTTTT
jgi:hypothetical protein